MCLVKNVFNCTKYCPILLETIGLRVQDRNFRDFRLFNFDFRRRNCPYARSVSAANAIDGDTDILNGCSVSVNIFG